MSKVKLTLVKSQAKKTAAVKLTLKALGFRKTHQVIEKETNPAINGMINRVKHLLKVETV
ncbi:MAG: 50S ribosomal protein L30 [Bacteroidia bacterium]